MLFLCVCVFFVLLCCLFFLLIVCVCFLFVVFIFLFFVCVCDSSRCLLFSAFIPSDVGSIKKNTKQPV